MTNDALPWQAFNVPISRNWGQKEKIRCLDLSTNSGMKTSLKMSPRFIQIRNKEKYAVHDTKETQFELKFVPNFVLTDTIGCVKVQPKCLY